MRNINNLLPIENDLVTKYISKFNDNNLIYDNIIKKVISLYPNNILFDDILIKVILINQIYSTNIFDVYQLARDIMYVNIDKHILCGDLNIVHEIANRYKISKNKYCYSFATKYCNFHNNNFPIFDNIVAEMLYLYMIKDKFSKFKKKELRNYNIFVNVLKDFKNFYKLNKIDYKDIDKFLWQYGKLFLYNDYI